MVCSINQIKISTYLLDIHNIKYTFSAAIRLYIEQDYVSEMKITYNKHCFKRYFILI